MSLFLNKITILSVSQRALQSLTRKYTENDVELMHLHKLTY